MSILYSKPNCPACIGTENFLEKYGIPYNKIDVTQDKSSYEKIRNLGYKSLPVIYVDETLHWQGIDMGKIKALAEQSLTKG